MKASKVSHYRIERYNGPVLHSVLHFDSYDTASLAMYPMAKLANKLSIYLIDNTGSILEYLGSTKDSKLTVDKNIKKEKENKQ